MPGKKKITHHIKSRQQQKFFGAAMHDPSLMPGMSKTDIKAHLDDSKGKHLPKKAHKMRSKAIGR